MKIKARISLSTVLVTGLLLSACSQQVQNEPAVVAPKTGTAHTHPANECTNSISHTHPNGGSAHKHRYSCKPKKMRSANEHTHPANSMTRSTRHNHPNGARKHSHHYGM